MKFFKVFLLCSLGLIHSVHIHSQNNEAGKKTLSSDKLLTGQLAPTPPMGWNTWNTFQTKINEAMLKEMVDTYLSSGMRDAGYEYFVLDDGWMAMERDQSG